MFEDKHLKTIYAIKHYVLRLGNSFLYKLVLESNRSNFYYIYMFNKIIQILKILFQPITTVSRLKLF